MLKHQGLTAVPGLFLAAIHVFRAGRSDGTRDWSGLWEVQLGRRLNYSLTRNGENLTAA
ncbi:hypothetical protein [Spirosoma sp.]|uniref:hypothetical protein n=1 Tax=Spirosoma sp. TaxID=1899569 RepID=UPI00261CC19C|nr:hypothetical protein [Spirosoma sp.]MCX6217304.1 hypothetical protein [Spirosoma sp.]